MSTDQGLYAQVVILCRKYLKLTKEIKIKMELNSSFKISVQDHRIGLIMILVLLRKFLAHVILSSIQKSSKGMMKHKKKIHLKRLKSKSEIQNV